MGESSDTTLILEAIKAGIDAQRDHASRAERNMETLGGEIRDMARAIVKAGRGDERGKPNVSLIVGVSSIVAALMVPMYVMLQGQASVIAEHKAMAGHPAVVVVTTALEEKVRQLEEKSDG